MSALAQEPPPATVAAVDHRPQPRRVAATPRKRLVRRTDRDYSQGLRRSFQIVFLLLNAWIGIQFYFWVRWAETGGASSEVSRPAGVEGWLPIEGLMQTKYVLLTRQLPTVHPAGFFLFTSFLVMSLFFRKAFCSWLCPVGTFSEYLWRLGRFIFRRNFCLPRWADVLLRSLKYLLLGFFVYAITKMSAVAIAQFLHSPYALVVDVRMLNFFRYLSGTSAYVVWGLVMASMCVQNFWCRYLCPYGAFLGIASLLSPLRITRTESTCINCAKCAKACPSALPVDKLVQIRSAECTGCLECLAICPAKDTLMTTAPYAFKKRRTVPAWAIAAMVTVTFFTSVGYAKLSGHWDTKLPKQIFLQLVPVASEQRHPMPSGLK